MKLPLRLFGRKLYYVIFRVRNTVTLYSTDAYVLVTHKRQAESEGGQKIPDGTWGRNRRGSRGVTSLKYYKLGGRKERRRAEKDRKEETEGTSFQSIIFNMQISCQIISFFNQADNSRRIGANIPIGIGR